jgi:hypothetical protein
MIFQCGLSQIIDCPKSLQGGIYQVYLDEPYYSADSVTTSSDLQILMDRLVFHMSSTMVGVIEDMGVTAPCAVIYCPGRKPQSTTIFNNDLVERLHTQDVVLEVWGSVESKKNESDELLHEARLHYLLIPVWVENSNNPLQPGIQSIEYKGNPQSGAEEALDLIEEAPEMHVFLKIGIGYNLLLNKEYNDARKLLCAASVELEEIINSKPPGDQSEKEKKLLEFVNQVASETVTSAKNDSNYNGALKLLKDNAACPCIQ